MIRSGSVCRILAGLLSLGLVAACGGASNQGGASASPIKVGYEVPLTGNFASNGRDEENGFKLGLKDFGDVVDGHKIVPIFADTAADPNQALSVAHQLVENQGVQIFEGPLAANEIAAVAAYLGPRGIPTDDLSMCSAIQLDYYVKFNNGLSSGWACNQPAIMAAEWAYNDMHWRHIVTVGQDFAFGWLVDGGFAAAFKQLGGTIDKMIWFPNTTLDFSPYVSQIPTNVDAVYAEVSGQVAVRFTQAYLQFGLRNKVPLFGITQMTDYSALPSEEPAAVLGLHTGAQYCDGIQSPQNQKFANEYKAAYGTYPGYYSDAGYTKARLLVAALKRLHGDVSNKKAVIQAMRTTPIVSARGPVKLSGPPAYSPIQNIYICQVEQVNGELRNVPIKTYKNVPPWGILPESKWIEEFRHDSAARPTP
ncbi:MAG TPA: penicillin-binding protein activator [Candidatus Dormibacteraeota bacterium]|nr:penicillin-binding protein activator [Candidatus Dormibacteraeota bacterium]